MKQTISISPKRVAQGMVVIALCLAVLSSVGHAAQYFLGESQMVDFVRLFNISGEANVPAWYASSTLLLAALLTAAAAAINKKRGERGAWHWAILSVIFFYISLDEAAQIHELVGLPLDPTRYADGSLSRSWVIPAAALLLIFAAAYLKFLFDLPAATRNLLVAAGLIFVAGALGLEAVETYLSTADGQRVVLRGLLATAEELLEMLGVVVFIYGVMSYLSPGLQDIQFRIGEAELPAVERSEQNEPQGNRSGAVRGDIPATAHVDPDAKGSNR